MFNDDIEIGPGFCRCCSAPLTRCGCKEWLPCECSAAVHACADDEDTAGIPVETMAELVFGGAQ